MNAMTPEDIIVRLSLEPRPEAGWFRETFRAVGETGWLGASASVYHMLEEKNFPAVIANSMLTKSGTGMPEHLCC